MELLNIWAEGKHGEVFGFVERLLDEGYDLVEFTTAWLTRFGPY